MTCVAKFTNVIESADGQDLIAQTMEYGFTLVSWAYHRCGNKDRATQFREVSTTVSESRRIGACLSLVVANFPVVVFVCGIIPFHVGTI